MYSPNTWRSSPRISLIRRDRLLVYVSNTVQVLNSPSWKFPTWLLESMYVYILLHYFPCFFPLDCGVNFIRTVRFATILFLMSLWLWSVSLFCVIYDPHRYVPAHYVPALIDCFNRNVPGRFWSLCGLLEVFINQGCFDNLGWKERVVYIHYKCHDFPCTSTCVFLACFKRHIPFPLSIFPVA